MTISVVNLIIITDLFAGFGFVEEVRNLVYLDLKLIFLLRCPRDLEYDLVLDVQRGESRKLFLPLGILNARERFVTNGIRSLVLVQ